MNYFKNSGNKPLSKGQMNKSNQSKSQIKTSKLPQQYINQINSDQSSYLFQNQLNFQDEIQKNEQAFKPAYKHQRLDSQKNPKNAQTIKHIQMQGASGLSSRKHSIISQEKTNQKPSQSKNSILQQQASQKTQSNMNLISKSPQQYQYYNQNVQNEHNQQIDQKQKGKLIKSHAKYFSQQNSPIQKQLMQQQQQQIIHVQPIQMNDHQNIQMIQTGMGLIQNNQESNFSSIQRPDNQAIQKMSLEQQAYKKYIDQKRYSNNSEQYLYEKSHLIGLVNNPKSTQSSIIQMIPFSSQKNNVQTQNNQQFSIIKNQSISQQELMLNEMKNKADQPNQNYIKNYHSINQGPMISKYANNQTVLTNYTQPNLTVLTQTINSNTQKTLETNQTQVFNQQIFQNNQTKVKKKYDETFLNRSISQVSNHENHLLEQQVLNKSQYMKNEIQQNSNQLKSNNQKILNYSRLSVDQTQNLYSQPQSAQIRMNKHEENLKLKQGIDSDQRRFKNNSLMEINYVQQQILKKIENNSIDKQNYKNNQQKIIQNVQNQNQMSNSGFVFKSVSKKAAKAQTRPVSNKKNKILIDNLELKNIGKNQSQLSIKKQQINETQKNQISRIHSQSSHQTSIFSENHFEQIIQNHNDNSQMSKIISPFGDNLQFANTQYDNVKKNNYVENLFNQNSQTFQKQNQSPNLQMSKNFKTPISNLNEDSINASLQNQLKLSNKKDPQKNQKIEFQQNVITVHPNQMLIKSQNQINFQKNQQIQDQNNQISEISIYGQNDKSAARMVNKTQIQDSYKHVPNASKCSSSSSRGYFQHRPQSYKPSADELAQQANNHRTESSLAHSEDKTIQNNLINSSQLIFGNNQQALEERKIKSQLDIHDMHKAQGFIADTSKVRIIDQENQNKYDNYNFATDNQNNNQKLQHTRLNKSSEQIRTLSNQISQYQHHIKNVNSSILTNSQIYNPLQQPGIMNTHIVEKERKSVANQPQVPIDIIKGNIYQIQSNIDKQKFIEQQKQYTASSNNYGFQKKNEVKKTDNGKIQNSKSTNNLNKQPYQYQLNSTKSTSFVPQSARKHRHQISQVQIQQIINQKQGAQGIDSTKVLALEQKQKSLNNEILLKNGISLQANSALNKYSNTTQNTAANSKKNSPRPYMKLQNQQDLKKSEIQALQKDDSKQMLSKSPNVLYQHSKKKSQIESTNKFNEIQLNSAHVQKQQQMINNKSKIEKIHKVNDYGNQGQQIEQSQKYAHAQIQIRQPDQQIEHQMQINQFLDGGTGSNPNVKIQKQFVSSNTNTKSNQNYKNQYIQSKNKQSLLKNLEEEEDALIKKIQKQNNVHSMKQEKMEEFEQNSESLYLRYQDDSINFINKEDANYYQLQGPLITEEDENEIRQVASDINEKAFFGKILRTKNLIQSNTYGKNIDSKLKNLSPRSQEIAYVMKKIDENFKSFQEPPQTTLDFYRIGKMLGRGAFGKVNLAMHKLVRKLVALKSLNKECLTDEIQKQKLMKEVNLLLKLRHNHVVKIYETIETKKHIIIVMELCAGGDLLNYVRKRRKLKEEFAKKIFKQIIDGLQYIHSKFVAHRDIKLDNILLDGKGQVKIADFGVSKQSAPNTKMREQCGTPAYIAPEILRNKNGYSFNVDIWSAGVVLYAMLYGTVPFKAASMEELHSLILKGVYTLKDDISQEARDMLRGLLEINPYKRFNYDQIYSHPWLKDLDESLQLFNDQEREMIKKEYTYNDPSRYNRNEQEEPIDCFTEHNIDSVYNTIKNCSEKSIILAPFNSTQSEDMEQFKKQIKPMLAEKNLILRLSRLCREIDRQYEFNNNGQLDNGVYHKQMNNSAEDGGQKGKGADKKKNKELDDQKSESEDEDDELKFQIVQCSKSQGRDFTTEEDEIQIKEKKFSYNLFSNMTEAERQLIESTFGTNKEMVIDEHKLDKLVSYGYPKDYIMQSLQQNDPNYITAGYYLLEMDQNYC